MAQSMTDNDIKNAFSGKREGKWEVNSGKLCEEFGKKGCHKLDKDGDVINKYNKNGKNIVTYKVFSEGNSL